MREVRGGRHAEEDRHEHTLEAGIDLSQLRQQRGTAFAVTEVLVDLAPVAGRQSVTGVRAQFVGEGTAAFRNLTLEVGLEVGLAQTFPGAVGQGGDGIGGQAEKRSDVGRALALYFGVPEHELPALGKLGERRGDQLLVLAGEVVDHQERGHIVLLVGDLFALGPLGPVVERIPDRGEQVGPERNFRTTATTKSLQDTGERLGDQVIRVDVGTG
jgi:hypothetical protein